MNDVRGDARLQVNLHRAKRAPRRVPGIAAITLAVVLLLGLYELSPSTANGVVLGLRWGVGLAWLYLARVLWRLGNPGLWLLTVAMAGWFLVRAVLDTVAMLT